MEVIKLGSLKEVKLEVIKLKIFKELESKVFVNSNLIINDVNLIKVWEIVEVFENELGKNFFF